MQRLQNRAARIITGNFDYVHVRGIDIVKQLKWMNAIERRDYFMALSVFKCIHGMAPLYLSDCITMNDEVVIRDTRASTSTNILMTPHAPLEIFKNSFSHRGPLTWNALPESIRKCATLKGMCSFNQSLIMCCFNHCINNILFRISLYAYFVYFLT